MHPPAPSSGAGLVDGRIGGTGRYISSAVDGLTGARPPDVELTVVRAGTLDATAGRFLLYVGQCSVRFWLSPAAAVA